MRHVLGDGQRLARYVAFQVDARTTQPVLCTVFGVAWSSDKRERDQCRGEAKRRRGRVAPKNGVVRGSRAYLVRTGRAVVPTSYARSGEDIRGAGDFASGGGAYPGARQRLRAA
jgi:hypothetical protein